MKRNNAVKLIVVFVAFASLIGCTKDIKTSVEIDASPQQTWKVLADFSKYPAWNPFIKKIEGDFQPGQVIEVEIQAEGSDPMNFEPTILQRKENKILEWKGQFLLPGLFTGQHRFILEEIGDQKTRFIHSENFYGILVPFFDFEGIEKGFRTMNAELKKRVEAR